MIMVRLPPAAAAVPRTNLLRPTRDTLKSHWNCLSRDPRAETSSSTTMSDLYKLRLVKTWADIWHLGPLQITKVKHFDPYQRCHSIFGHPTHKTCTHEEDKSYLLIFLNRRKIGHQIEILKRRRRLFASLIQQWVSLKPLRDILFKRVDFPKL